MVDKYRCYGKDDLGYPYDAKSIKEPDGDWVRAEDYDALEAAANAVLKAYMPQFPNSLAVDDCLVNLAAAICKPFSSPASGGRPDDDG
jgi:hypothetical protein